MKKINRFGIIVLVIGLSFFVVTILRSSSPCVSFSVGKDAIVLSDDWQLYQDFLFPPQILRIEIDANTTSNVYVLDQKGINLWEENQSLEPIWSLTEITQQVETIQVGSRGTYGILLQNISDEPGTIRVTSSLYGIEADLLFGSIITLILGAVIIILSRGQSFLLPRKSQKSSKYSTFL
jgi:hypothetical protein